MQKSVSIVAKTVQGTINRTKGAGRLLATKIFPGRKIDLEELVSRVETTFAVCHIMGRDYFYTIKGLRRF